MAERPRASVVLADDEELARAVLREFLSAHPDVTIAAECAHGFEAVKAVQETKPDLLFLDVRMPGLDGFEVLELLDPAPAVVFVTAYDFYAVRAFDTHAVDYLLKPFDRERFEKALQRGLAAARSGAPRAGPPPEAARASGTPRRVVVRDGAEVILLPFETIDWIEAQDDYVALRSGGRDHLKQETLQRMEERLPGERFVRIHRSYLLNLDRLARLESGATGRATAVLHDGSRLPVSRVGARRLKETLAGRPR